MRIAVCDDNDIDREILIGLLHAYLSDRVYNYKLEAYDSGVHLLCDIEGGEIFDIVFLDVFMDVLLGIDVARRLRINGFNGSIILMSGSATFAVDGYDVEASGYLLKPYNYEKLRLCMSRIMRSSDVRTYQIISRNGIYRIPYSEILYVESCNSRCILHRQGGEEYSIYKKLGQIEDELSDMRFLRYHRSYIVNLDFVAYVDRQFTLSTSDIVLIRQKDFRIIKQKYLDYLSHKMA